MITLKGYALHCTLRRAYPILQPPLHIIAVYMPEEMNVRRAIYAYIGTVLAQLERSGEDMLVLGDFNAVLHNEDRTGCFDAADQLHRQQVSLLNLSPLGNSLPGRAHTFFKAQGPNTPPCTSRIDDILLWKKPSNAQPMPEATLEPGGNLDHTSLIVNIPCSILPGSIPAPHSPMVKDSSLAYPIKKSELAETRIKVASSVEIHDVWAVVRGYKDTLLADLKGDHNAKNVCSTSVEHQLNHDSRTIVDRLGAALTSKLQEAHRIMMDTCTKEPPPQCSPLQTFRK